MVSRRRLLVSVSGAVLLAAVTTVPVWAGEVTGSGGSTHGPANANSICVFSGLNDDPDAPITLDEELAPNGPGGISQSYGQSVRRGLLSPHVVNPGDACRGFSNPARQR